MSIYLDKKSVYTRLHDEKHVLYNYVTNILLDRVIRKKLVENGRKIQLIASQRETNKFLNDNFSSYLTKINSENHKIDLKICIESHYKNKVLQLADAISWTLFRKREHGDDSYYQIIKDKVVEENKLFR